MARWTGGVGMMVVGKIEKEVVEEEEEGTSRLGGMLGREKRDAEGIY